MPDPPRVDYVGGLLSVLTLTSIVYGAIEGPERGWGSPETLGAFAFGGVALAAWLVWSLKVAEPLLDPRLFLRRGFSTGVASISLQFFVFFGFVFVIVQYLQLVLHYSPLQAGLALLPMGMAISAVSRRVPHLVDKAGRRPLAVAGLVLMATGMTLLSTLDLGSSYWLVLGGIVPVGVGMALAMAPATTDIVAALPLHKQGVASATNDAAREVGGTLGIAVLGSILNDQYRAGVAEAAPASAPDGLVGTAQESLGAALGSRLASARVATRWPSGHGARSSTALPTRSWPLRLRWSCARSSSRSSCHAGTRRTSRRRRCPTRGAAPRTALRSPPG